ncbi:MAG: phosphomannomutase/phosphoglucomutase [Gemmatimonadetes bacterium]|nr:phosphomannomutase/phosphoglucomutase [Gemmatimonadota bacterium]
MELTAHIFREYDIRGIVGEGLDPQVAEAVGRAYGTILREAIPGRTPTVVVGRDNRPSSPDLSAGLVSGLRSAGVDVTDIGTVPTPLVYWAEPSFGADGGIQITGSHNPPEYNGIKMNMQGRSFFGQDIQRLRARIESGDLAAGEGSVEEEDVLQRYIDDVTSRFEPKRGVKVVLDCGNGVASVLAVPLLEAMGAEVVPLFCESDGTFPNHHPDPTVDEYIVDMIAAVRSTGAEIGIAFDGDGDRIGVVDQNGCVVRGDIVLLLLALDILDQREDGAKLVFDVKCSQVLPDVFAQAGGEPIMWRTGHSHIKAKMRESGAEVGGELSGHICFADKYLGFDDALYAACRMVDYLSRKEVPLSELAGELPHFVSTPEIRIDVTEETKFGLVEKALNHFRSEHDVIDVDGVRVLFEDGWGLLRASNTQPVIVARFEAKSQERLSEIQGVMNSWLRENGIDV